MKTVIIAAKSDNNVIARKGRIPWRLPADEHFLALQLRDGVLLTGRVSFESNQGAEIFDAPERTIVITRRPDYQTSMAYVAHSVEEGLKMARGMPWKRLCILGGAEIYRATMAIADELIITEVHTTVEGDTFFPAIDRQEWRVYYREDHPPDAENPHAYSFVYYSRMAPGE